MRVLTEEIWIFESQQNINATKIVPVTVMQVAYLKKQSMQIGKLLSLNKKCIDQWMCLQQIENC